MPTLQAILDPKAAHLLAYGTLFGSTFFQTFFAGPIAYTALPRPNFSQLQLAIFPPFFAMQSVLPLVLALTWPGTKSAAVGSAVLRENVGAKGVIHANNLWSVLVPLAVMLVSGVVNLAILGPLTRKIMRERKHLETKEGKRYYDPGPKSKEMQKMNSSFGMIHGTSASLNLVGLISMVWYGYVLADML